MKPIMSDAEYFPMLRGWLLELKTTKRQRNYIRTLINTFNIKDAEGNIFPYRPLLYQVKYHIESKMAKPKDYMNRFIIKGRGLGASIITDMDNMLEAKKHPSLSIPVCSTGKEAEAMSPIEWCIWLAKHTKTKNVFKIDPTVKSRLEYLDNGSKIISIPPHNYDKFRRLRTTKVHLDEFDLMKKQREMLNAADDTMSEGGQLDISSTVQDELGEFWKIYENAEEYDFKVFEWPTYPINQFDVKIPIPEQNLYPIAFWINQKKLENKRKRDPLGFMQEQMCTPMSAKEAFMPLPLIYGEKTKEYPRGIHVRPKAEIFQHERMSTNPYYLGVDVGYLGGDECALNVFEVTPQYYIMRYRDIFNDMDTMELSDEITRLHAECFQFNGIGIDMSTMGAGVYDRLNRSYRNIVTGLIYQSKPLTKDKVRSKIPLRKLMANNFIDKFIDNQIIIIDAIDLIRDYHSIKRKNLDAPRRKGKHGNEFWASAGAIYIAKKPYTKSKSTAFYHGSTTTFGRRGARHEKNPELVENCECSECGTSIRCDVNRCPECGIEFEEDENEEPKKQEDPRLKKVIGLWNYHKR